MAKILLVVMLLRHKKTIKFAAITYFKSDANLLNCKAEMAICNFQDSNVKKLVLIFLFIHTSLLGQQSTHNSTYNVRQRLIVAVR